MKLSFLRQFGFTAKIDEALQLCLERARTGDPDDIEFLVTNFEESATVILLAEQEKNPTLTPGQVAFVKAVNTLVDDDLELAKKHLVTAAEENIAQAMHHLGNLAYNINDVEEAAMWYRKAANLNHVPSMVWLANILEDQGQETSAEELWIKARELGSTLATYRYGMEVANQQTLAHALPQLRKLPPDISDLSLEALDPDLYFDLGQRLDELNMTKIANQYVESGLISIAYMSTMAFTQANNLNSLNFKCPWFANSQDLLDSAVDIESTTKHEVIWE